MCVYRPYVDVYRTANVLSPHDLAVTKMRTGLLIRNILIKKGWLDDEQSGQNAPDHFFNYYYNGGRPYLDFLLEYYYAVYTAWLNNNGDVGDFCEGYNGIYDSHRKDCAIEDNFDEPHTLMYKLHLLNFDRFYYKRHFMNIKNLELVNEPEKFFIKNSHRIVLVKKEVREIQ